MLPCDPGVSPQTGTMRKRLKTGDERKKTKREEGKKEVIRQRNKKARKKTSQTKSSSSCYKTTPIRKKNGVKAENGPQVLALISANSQILRSEGEIFCLGKTSMLGDGGESAREGGKDGTFTIEKTAIYPRKFRKGVAASLVVITTPILGRRGGKAEG